MSQSPYPHDPYGTDPSAPVPEQPGTSDSAAPGASQNEFLGATPPHSEPSAPAEHAAPAGGFAPQDGAPHHDAPQDGAPQDGAPQQYAAGDQASPTSDPTMHPHDPFAYSAGAPGYGAGPQGPGGAQGQYGDSGQYGTAGQSGPQGHPGQQGQQGQPGQQGQYAPYGTESLDVPPPGFKGVYDGPLTGQPMPDSEARTWALVVHLAALLQFVIPFVGGLIAQIVLYVIFKDRNRFVRYNAAEGLNGTIAALIVSLAMGVVFTIITIVTFGIGAFLFGLMFLPTLVQAIFAIIGAVRAYQGTWWNYPVNVRMVK